MPLIKLYEQHWISHYELQGYLTNKLEIHRPEAIKSRNPLPLPALEVYDPKNIERMQRFAEARETESVHPFNFQSAASIFALLTRNISAYSTGTTAKVSSVETSNPPIIASAIGSHISPPPR